MGGDRNQERELRITSVCASVFLSFVALVVVAWFHQHAGMLEETLDRDTYFLFGFGFAHGICLCEVAASILARRPASAVQMVVLYGAGVAVSTAWVIGGGVVARFAFGVLILGQVAMLGAWSWKAAEEWRGR